MTWFSSDWELHVERILWEQKTTKSESFLSYQLHSMKSNSRVWRTKPGKRIDLKSINTLDNITLIKIQ